MQEEVEQRIVSLMISCGKLGEQEFRKAVAKLLEQLKSDHQKHQYSKANPHGKMTVKQLAAKDCRAVYDAGCSPICPTLFLPLFLRDEIPQEHKDGIDMAREHLRRARVLVVCGSIVDESVKNDIAVAERLRITATTLDGILTVKGQGRRNE